MIAALLFFALLQPTTAPASRPAVEIGPATTLYLPASFEPGGEIDLVVHFHGGGASVAGEIERLGLDAALVVYSPGGRSSAYSTPFREPEAFAKLLQDSRRALRERDEVPDDAELGTICLTAWSAGYGAVREILKQPENEEKVAGILLADALYSGYVGDPEEKVVDPELMAPFVAYARKAIAGERSFVVTHTYIVPPGYAGTHETADYLVETLGLEWEAMQKETGVGITIDREAGAGKLHLVGGEGDAAEDHVRHVRHIGLWLDRLPLEARE